MAAAAASIRRSYFLFFFIFSRFSSTEGMRGERELIGLEPVLVYSNYARAWACNKKILYCTGVSGEAREGESLSCTNNMTLMSVFVYTTWGYREERLLLLLLVLLLGTRWEKTKSGKRWRGWGKENHETPKKKRRRYILYFNHSRRALYSILHMDVSHVSLFTVRYTYIHSFRFYRKIVRSFWHPESSLYHFFNAHG